MCEEDVVEDAVAERNILYDRLVPVEWSETTTILVQFDSKLIVMCIMYVLQNVCAVLCMLALSGSIHVCRVAYM